MILWQRLLRKFMHKKKDQRLKRFDGFIDENGKRYGNDDFIPIGVKLIPVYTYIDIESKSCKK